MLHIVLEFPDGTITVLYPTSLRATEEFIWMICGRKEWRIPYGKLKHWEIIY